MEARSHAIITGLFTILLGIALAATFVWFRGDAHKYTEFIVVSKLAVNGLYPQATVRFRGVEVGKVENISLDTRDARNILIRIRVVNSVPITRGTFAQLGYQGVTGIAYILLDDDGTSPVPLQVQEDGLARIEVRGNAFDDLAQSSKVLLKQAGELLDRLNSMVNADNQARLANTLSNFERASAQLEPALKAIPDVAERAKKLFGDENQQSLRRSLANLEQATGAISPVAEDSRKVLANMRALSEKLDRLGTEISAEITESTLPKVNDLVSQLDRDSRDFHRLVLQFEREPQSLVFGRPSPEPGPGEPGFKSGRK
jgi:phospholipid/cholesterol/gamma-HCH transport system substrate-binding protein